MHELLSPSSLIAVLALAALEIVLGVDNLVFIAILTARLPADQQSLARRLGLAVASVGRIALLLAASWLIMLDKSRLFAVGDWDLTVRDLILIAGGLFLLAKATWEIHHSLEGDARGDSATAAGATLSGILAQILLLDLVFSIDSVLTAVGMVEPEKFSAPPIPGTSVPWPAMALMTVALLSAVAVMIWFVNPVSEFIESHPTVKMLALAFLLLIGVVLIADGLGQHIPRGYIYFAMGFSVFVELLNIRVRGRVDESDGP